MKFTYNQQVEVFKNELMKVFDYIEIDKVYQTRAKIKESGVLSREEILILILFANYAGTLLRVSYYKYVHQQGFDVRALFDAAVIIYTLNNVHQFDFESLLKKKKVKDIINRTSFPEWTKIGLVGGSTKKINQLGKDFSRYMDQLSEVA